MERPICYYEIKCEVFDCNSFMPHGKLQSNDYLENKIALNCVSWYLNSK